MSRRWFLLILALVYAIFLAIGAMIPRKPEPTGAFFEVNGHKVHYIQAGNGPDLVLLHGASGSFLDWTYGPLGKLARTHRVTAFDRPGLGHSDLIENAEDLRVQARHLMAASKALGLVKPRVIGHSFGGAVALAWALEDQNTMAGLMLLSTPSHVWPTGLAWHYQLATTPVVGPIAARLLPAFAGQRLADGIVSSIFEPQDAPVDYAAHIQTNIALQPNAILANAAQVMALKEQLRAFTPLYPNLTLPVEILHGDADTAVSMTIHSLPLSQALPSANFTRLEGIGHMPQHTNWDAIAAALERLEAQIN